MFVRLRANRHAGLITALTVLNLVPLWLYVHAPSRVAVSDYVSEKHAQWFQSNQSAITTTDDDSIPCDPNTQPGFPNYARWYWETANEDCPGDSDLYMGLRNENADLWNEFPEFRNKSILIAGDSVGRHIAETLCIDILHQKLEQTETSDFKHHYAWTAACTVPQLGLKIAMIHIYGMANTSDPAVNEVLDKAYQGMGKDWDLQSRVHRWWNTTLKGFEPDYVQLNSGAWEYRYWFVRDILQNKRHEDMPVEDRETNARMAIQSMDFFQNKWPKAKVWYMHMSMMNENDILIKKAHGKNWIPKDRDPEKDDSYPPLYTWRRQSQYRATMRTRIAEAGYDSLDYGQIQAVMSRQYFSKEDDVIHPQLAAKRIMSVMILSKIRRHVRYGV